MAINDVYRQLREKVAGYSGPYAEHVLLVPDLLALVTRLMMDPRVDARHKAYLGAALAYVVSPIDIISERTVGPLGYVDDVAVIVAALNNLLNEVDPQIVLQHWSGSGDLLASIRKILVQADGLVGKGRLDKILEAIGIRRPASGPAPGL